MKMNNTQSVEYALFILYHRGFSPYISDRPFPSHALSSPTRYSYERFIHRRRRILPPAECGVFSFSIFRTDDATHSKTNCSYSFRRRRARPLKGLRQSSPSSSRPRKTASIRTTIYNIVFASVCHFFFVFLTCE